MPLNHSLTAILLVALGCGLLGRPVAAQQLPPRLMGTGSSHSALIAADGTLYTWGLWGETNQAVHSNDTVFYSATPSTLPVADCWRQVAAGDGYTLAIRQDGTLWGWGQNAAGQLGDGTRTSRYHPVQVGHAANWQRISAYYNLSLGVRTDGTLWAWGTNSNGQLGLDTLSRSYVPRRVGTATNWTEVVAGFWHCVGVRADGTLWAWGDNRLCLFDADSTRLYQRTPRQVGADTTWVAAAVGWYHTAALRTDGTLWTWGRNHFGMLGNNTHRSSRVPQQAGTDTSWRQVSAGGQHTMAVRSDGTLWAWGRNEGENWLGFDWGYLQRAGLLVARPGFKSPVQIDEGYGAFIARPLPVDSTCTWLAVESTAEHTLAVRADSSVWAWGYNNSGQAGPRANYQTGPIRLAGLRALLPAVVSSAPPPSPARPRRRLRLFGH
jgi:hypothetical protein